MATPTRIIPLTGPEADRDLVAAEVLTNELHTTTDQKRFFMENTFLGPALHHPDVVNETARLAMTPTRGVWPGDTVVQTNTGVVYKCVSNNGELASDWISIGGGISLPSTNRVNGYVLSIDTSDPTGYQWVDVGHTYVPANPYEPRDIWLYGAWDPDTRDLQDERDIWMDAE